MVFDSIKTLLGEPYLKNEHCIIYHGDCLEYLKSLPSSLIKTVVTSPPYNIGKEYENKLPLEKYIDWCQNWIAELHRLIEADGSFWLNVGYLEFPEKAKALPIPYLLWDKTPFYLIQEIIWNYGAGVAGKKYFSPRNEKILWYVKNMNSYTFNLNDIRDKNVKYPNQKKNGKLKCNPLGKNPSDVWQIPKVTSGKNRSSKERTPHPAQFPLALIDRIIKASSNENDIILDPFMGSGTTAIAALYNKRKFIGIEIQEQYCHIAAERIKRAINSPKQVELFC